MFGFQINSSIMANAEKHLCVLINLTIHLFVFGKQKATESPWVDVLKRISPGAKMGTWKCLRVQGFMIDPESIGVLKEIKLGCHDGNPGELFLFA